MSETPTFGRYAEIPTDQLSPEQTKGYELVMKERGQVPGPYKIFLQNPSLMEVVVPIGVYFETGKSSLSKAEIEVATNVINSKWLAAYSNYEHEMIAEKAGLAAEKVQAIIAGQPTSFEDPRQQVIYETSLALTAPRVVPTGLYQRAVDLLGDKGLTDLTMLLGYFTTISLTLSAYNVPYNAVGLKR